MNVENDITNENEAEYKVNDTTDDSGIVSWDDSINNNGDDDYDIDQAGELSPVLSDHESDIEDDDSFDIEALPKKFESNTVSKRPTSAANTSLGALKRKAAANKLSSEESGDIRTIVHKEAAEKPKPAPASTQSRLQRQSSSKDKPQLPLPNKSLDKLQNNLGSKKSSSSKPGVKSDKTSKKVYPEPPIPFKPKTQQNRRFSSKVRDDDLLPIANPEDGFDRPDEFKAFMLDQETTGGKRSFRTYEKDASYSSLTPKLKAVDNKSLRKVQTIQKNNFVEHASTEKRSLERQQINSNHPLKSYEKTIEKDLRKALVKPYPMANIVELKLGDASIPKLPPKSKPTKQMGKDSNRLPIGKRESKLLQAITLQDLDNPKFSNFLLARPVFPLTETKPSNENYFRETQTFIPSPSINNGTQERMKERSQRRQIQSKTVIGKKMENPTQLNKVTFDDPFNIQPQLTPQSRAAKSHKPKKGFVSRMVKERQRSSSLQRQQSNARENFTPQILGIGQSPEVWNMANDLLSDGYAIPAGPYRPPAGRFQESPWNDHANHYSADNLRGEGTQTSTPADRYGYRPSLQFTPSNDYLSSADRGYAAFLPASYQASHFDQFGYPSG